MARSNARLESARIAYREALEAARADPSPDAWARLLQAGKDLSAAQDPKRSSRRARRRPASEREAKSEGSLDLEPSFE